MAHELYEIDGEYSMAYLKGSAPPWHGLGQTVPKKASLDTWAKKSHLDYGLVKAGMTYFKPDTGNIALVEDRHVILRDDDYSFLSSVSGKYELVQPKEVLQFFSDLIKTADFELVTAGSLFNGKKYWAMAKIREGFKLMGIDPIEGYLLLTTSCDGSLSNTGMFTSTRVVCNNTLSYAISKGESGTESRYIRMPHTAQFDPEKMKYELGLGKDAFGRFKVDVQKLAKTKMTTREAFDFFLSIYGVKEDEEEKSGDEVVEAIDIEKLISSASNNKEIKKALTEATVNMEKVPIKNVVKMVDLFQNGKGQDLKSAKGTAWGAVNAVTEFFDHHAGNRNMDTRINSAFFGKGQKLKSRAFDYAMKLAA